MHVSAFTLDQRFLGALDLAALAEVDAHLESCERCRRDRDAAAALRQHFIARTLPVPRRRPAWWWLAVPMVVAIAAIVLLVRPEPAPPALTIKGDATWQLFANRGGQTFAVQDGTPLAVGDRIRFVITPDGARYVLVVSIDGAGASTVYYPYGGAASAAVTAQGRIELPGSIVLDAAPGPECVFALFSDEPIEAATIEAQLHAIGDGGAQAIRAPHTLAAKVRSQTSLVFEKVAP